MLAGSVLAALVASVSVAPVVEKLGFPVHRVGFVVPLAESVALVLGSESVAPVVEPLGKDGLQGLELARVPHLLDTVQDAATVQFRAVEACPVSLRGWVPLGLVQSQGLESETLG